MLTISVLNQNQSCKARASGTGDVTLFYEGYYENGDVIQVATDEGRHLSFQAARALDTARLYLSSDAFQFKIPAGEARDAYPPQAFSGYRHVITARTEDATGDYRNLALNPADQNGAAAAYPHVSANAETRGESVFQARNVIDGLRLNTSHGEWPFQSWGVDIQEDACITLEFGRPVSIDKMALTIRADFPHDSYWTEGTFTFSDGNALTAPLQKTAGRQWIECPAHTAEWIKLSQLVKADDPSPFPALVEWEVFGREL